MFQYAVSLCQLIPETGYQLNYPITICVMAQALTQAVKMSYNNLWLHKTIKILFKKITSFIPYLPHPVL